jgi:hypothetical protein
VRQNLVKELSGDRIAAPHTGGCGCGCGLCATADCEVASTKEKNSVRSVTFCSVHSRITP